MEQSPKISINMKICFFTDDITKVGGIERVTSTLVNQLSKTHVIEIVSIFKGRETPHYPFPANVTIHYVTHKAHGKKPHSIKRIITLLSSIRDVRRFFKTHNYDYVVAQSFPPALSMYVSGFDRKKIIACEHVYAGYYGKVIQNIRKIIYRKFIKIVVLTNNDKKVFSEQLSKGQIEVIPNPIVIQSTDNNSSRATISRRIITAGRLEYQKGYDNLIKCFAEVHKIHSDWTLDIYGEGSLRSYLQNLIDSINLKGSVFLKGITNQLGQEFEKSQFFVLSSHFEGFPMVLIEALSHGLPVISYDCPNGPSDIVTGQDNGILVENQNMVKLANAIVFLIENPTTLKKFAENSRKSVERFHDTEIAKRWNELFIKINTQK